VSRRSAFDNVWVSEARRAGLALAFGTLLINGRQMMSATSARKCPDCEGAMKDIEIIDKTVGSVGLESINFPQQTSLEYVVPGGKKSFWSGGLPIEGKVSAVMCEKCGRILLFGVPSKK
jgi:hypothetical protein